jgi:periplasmic protein CpxP/Spy
MEGFNFLKKYEIIKLIYGSKKLKMKRKLLFSVLAIAISLTTVKAQEAAMTAAPAGMEQKQPNERTKETLLKLQTDLGLSSEQGGKAYPVFEEFYTAQQKMRDEMRAAGGEMDREKMKATREEMTTKRDDKLKLIFTEAQMKRWKDEIEPSMRPQRKTKQ